MNLRKHIVICVLLLLSWTPVVMPGEETSWRQPRREILDVLHAEDLPIARLSPTGEVLALMKVLRYPPIADLAQPMLRLAGVRINPRTNGRHYDIPRNTYTEVTLLRVADAKETKLALPVGVRVMDWQWSADGKRFAFLNQASNSIELWVGKTASGQIRRIKGLRINPLLYSKIAWMPDQRTILVKCIPTGRGAPPPKPPAPPGPRIQESSGASATSTYESRDLLTGPYDEALFEHYTLSQLALVDAESGQVTALCKPGILSTVLPAPGGRLILVERLHKPWSYQYRWFRFGHDVEIWDVDGNLVHVAARKPLADQVPIHGEPEGPRDYEWRSTEPATLVWLEALDGGDPDRKSAYRDRIMMQKAPFQEDAREIYRAPHRIRRLWWGQRDGLLMVFERERERRWKHVWALNADDPSSAPRHLIDQSINDRYSDPGYPVRRQLPTGAWVVVQDGNDIFLSGRGASPQGDRPFLDRLSLSTLKSERLFRCDNTIYEYFTSWLDLGKKTFLTQRQSPTETPNYFIRSLKGKFKEAEAGEAEWETDLRPLTSFHDPTPQLRGITQKIVTYERADGTPLSFKLFLPPGYQPGRRLPTVINAYPLEYSDPKTAGQVRGSDKRFHCLTGTTSLFFLLDGYAVLQNVAMPVIGDPDTAYDTFIEQLVASAEAAIDKAVELGVTDRQRVGVIGHSHGGLMAATLLAHSDLFRSGIALSGAYNHTMRPFGFQKERRTLWQAMNTYIRLSPVMHANKINEPLLLIHGQADQNPGTVPLQSEKFYEAIRGTGGNVRLIMLPHELHVYRSREAVEQILAEQLDWFERYVKNAPARKK